MVGATFVARLLGFSQMIAGLATVSATRGLMPLEDVAGIAALLAERKPASDMIRRSAPGADPPLGESGGTSRCDDGCLAGLLRNLLRRGRDPREAAQRAGPAQLGEAGSDPWQGRDATLVQGRAAVG